jgi:hypothetical protein
MRGSVWNKHRQKIIYDTCRYVLYIFCFIPFYNKVLEASNLLKYSKSYEYMYKIYEL